MPCRTASLVQFDVYCHLPAFCYMWPTHPAVISSHVQVFGSLQATEFIVDFAQKSRKPFAVVPCCVYSSEFPTRRLPCGELVRTYEQLLDYLVAKDAIHIKVATLAFEGKNKVVYCTSWTD